MKIGNSPPIHSAANYGQTGLQRSQDKLDNASNKVAKASVEEINNINQETETRAEEKSERLYGSPIQDGLIEAKTSELEAQANAKVIKAADDNIGTLIDIKA